MPCRVYLTASIPGWFRPQAKPGTGAGGISLADLGVDNNPGPGASDTFLADLSSKSKTSASASGT